MLQVSPPEYKPEPEQNAISKNILILPFTLHKQTNLATRLKSLQNRICLFSLRSYTKMLHLGAFFYEHIKIENMKTRILVSYLLEEELLKINKLKELT